MKQGFLFITKKLLRLIALIIAICILTFSLLEISPIDPIKTYVGGNMMKLSEEKRAEIEAYWGLNDPTPVRFWKWAKAALSGDLGDSLIYKQPVIDIIGEKFKASFALMIVAWILSGLLGFLFALFAGGKPGGWLDKGIKTYCYLLMATPTFWLCLILVLIFSVWLGWFPATLGTPIGVLAEDVSVWDLLHHMVLPAITLSVVGIASITLFSRQKLVEIMSTDYMLFAKARGETLKQRITNHGLRNMLLPFITLQFLSFSELFAGSILVEKVFSYPGLGQATVDAGLKGDVPLLMGIVLFSTIFVYIGNLIADILYVIIDPRMRKGAAL
ncbi:ABC transporter permease [Bacillus sp. FJAT-18019]|nr:ABC transporter permease [Bacillus sp. FJAT-18019]